MGTMKTTLEISDPIFEQLKLIAVRQKTSFKQIVDMALQKFLAFTSLKPKKTKLKIKPFGGDGFCEGIDPNDWGNIRDISYAGRGT